MNSVINESGFRAWAATQNYRPTTANKYLDDLRTYVSNPDKARNPASLQRAFAFHRAYWIYEMYARATGDDGLDVPPPPEPASHQPAEMLGGVKRRRRGGDAEEAREKPFEPKEWRRLLAIVQSDETPLGIAVAILARTGMRVGDVLRVTKDALVSAFKREDGTISLELKGGKQVVSTVQIAEAEWLRMLQIMKERQASNVAEAVSVSGDPNPTAGGAAYTALDRHFKKLCQEAAISDRAHLHRIRRTIACSLQDQGVPNTEIQQVLGHKSPQTTAIYLRGYAPAQVKGTLQKLKW